MSSSRPEPQRRHTSVRLTAWYAAVFIVSSLILFGLAYFLLSATVREHDRRAVSEKVREYASIAQSQGLSSLLSIIHQEEGDEAVTDYFIRIDAGGTTIVRVAPPWWPDGPKHVAPSDVSDSVRWDLWPSQDGEALAEVAIRSIAGGATLFVGMDAADREELLGNFQKIFLLVVLLTGLMGIIGGSILAHRTLRPISDLIQTVSAIDHGSMDARVPSRGGSGELDGLVQLFNGMLDRIKSLVTGMRETLDNAAHDLRTPLTRMRMGIESALQRSSDPGACREALLDCAEECERIMTMLETLMDISEAETGVMQLSFRSTDLAGLVEEAAEAYRYIAEEKGVSLAVDLPERIFALVDPARVRQVLANLLDNAVKYTPAGGRVSVSLAQTEDRALLVVRDTGLGISAADMPRIFERLYRADRSRTFRGLGLGLSLVRAVLKAHGGEISVDSEPGKGSAFTVSLPLRPSAL